MKPKKQRKDQVKNVKFLHGVLGCQRCANQWNVVDLNPEHKFVTCPVCGEPNDIKEAMARGKGRHVREAA